MDDPQVRICRHSGALSDQPIVTAFTVGTGMSAANPRATNDGPPRPNGGRGGWGVSRRRAGRVFALLAMGIGLIAPAQAADWQVIAERDGIVVSRRAVQGRAFPQLRAVGEVPGTPY